MTCHVDENIWLAGEYKVHKAHFPAMIIRKNLIHAKYIRDTQEVILFMLNTINQLH